MWLRDLRCYVMGILDNFDALVYTATIEKDESVHVKEKGAALVEFALVAPLFFLVLFAIIEFGYLYWANLSMQHAVREGARYAVVTGVTGFTAPSPTPAEQRCAAVVQEIRNNSMGFYDKVSPVVSFRTVDAAGNVVNIGSGCGAASQIIVIHLDCTLPLITPIIRPFFTDGNYRFAVSATMRNEAFH